MEKMTKDLTNLSMADSKTLPLEFEKVDLNKLIQEVFETLNLKIKEKGLIGITNIPKESIL